MQLIQLGMGIIFVGIVIVLIGALTTGQKSDTKVAVGGFIGFIPFGFGNDKNLLWMVMGISAIMLLIFIVLSLVKT